MRASILAVGILLAFACGGTAQIAPQTLVDNAFPVELTTKDDSAPIRYTSFVEDHAGSRIVALYSDGSAAMIQVLSATGEVLSRSSVDGLKGGSGTLELNDLDGDGQPEIIARLYNGHGLPIPDSWIFRIQPGTLALISPVGRRTPDSFQITLLSQIGTVDIDGDGKKEVIALPGVVKNGSGDLTADGDIVIYTLRNGSFAPVTDRYVFAELFTRSTRAPNGSTKAFSAKAGPATLLVVNGDSRPAVTSGHITLNGQELVGPADFKKAAGRISVPAKLLAQNALSVQLEGMPNSGIMVLVHTPQ
jgi:hypothetical protein